MEIAEGVKIACWINREALAAGRMLRAAASLCGCVIALLLETWHWECWTAGVQSPCAGWSEARGKSCWVKKEHPMDFITAVTSLCVFGSSL